MNVKKGTYNITLFPDLATSTHMDDEYVWAGVKDPKIVITTSHNPSSRLKQFAKVPLCYVFILCQYTMEMIIFKEDKIR